MAWSGERWTVDSAGAHIQAAKATTSEIFDEASALYKTGDNDNAKARFKWAVKSQNAKQIGAMIQLARTDPRVVTDHTQFDADQWLLNVRNGTVDLWTGKLQQHRREDLIAKLCPVVYDPGEACPVWNGFWQSQPWLRASRVHGLPRSAGRPVLLQGPVVPVLCGPAHERAGGPPRGSRSPQDPLPTICTDAPGRARAASRASQSADDST